MTATDAAIAQAFRERLESMYSPLTVREVMKAVEARARELDAEKGGEKEYGPGSNTGHGHVWKRPDGVTARCGGPVLCLSCRADAKHYTTTPPAQAAEAVAWRSKNFDPLLSGGFAWSFTTDPGSVTARHEGLYVNVAADAIAAARYRWLRDYAGIIEESGPLVFHADKDARPGTPIDGRLLDAAIDAAIAAMQGVDRG